MNQHRGLGVNLANSEGVETIKRVCVWMDWVASELAMKP